MFRSERMKLYMGVPDYLPDTELERLNSKAPAKVEIPKTYTLSELKKLRKQQESATKEE